MDLRIRLNDGTAKFYSKNITVWNDQQGKYERNGSISFINDTGEEYDKKPNLKLGDIISIEKPGFYIQGKFAVKDINYTYNNELDEKWIVTVKSSDLISSYIDLFRPEEKEENQKSIDTVILSEFVEEQINEVHSIELEQGD